MTPTAEQHPTVVIGAGLTGAIAAFRLAEAGQSCLVLERGRRWPVTPDGRTFPTFFEPDQRCSWLRGSPTYPHSPPASFEPCPGLVESYRGDTIDVVCGAGVGGSTLVSAGMLMRPEPEDLDRLVPDAQKLWDVHYPLAMHRLGGAPVPVDLLLHARYTSSALFVKHARQAGFEPERAPVAVDWDLVRAELTGRTAPAATIGETLYGINSGARNSVDRNYLAWAERSGHTQVRPLHEAREIIAEPDGYLVRCARRDESGLVVENVDIKCSLLILAAGSAGTTRLLVRARDTGTLPRLNDEVGRHWGNNAHRVYLRTGVPERTRAKQGGPACVSVSTRDELRRPLTIEHGPAPLPLEANVMTISGLGVPDELGEWSFDGEDVCLTWPENGDATAVSSIRRTLDHLVETSGGALVDLNAGRNHTFHPLGGVALGKACDEHGQVFGHSRLYVVDGSLLPGHAAGSNPAWTLAALAEHCMDEVVAHELPHAQAVRR